MIISCPRCATDFAVPDRALGAAGRAVKCSSCGHLWRQRPADPGAFLTPLMRIAPLGNRSGFMPSDLIETESVAPNRRYLPDPTGLEAAGFELDGVAHDAVMPLPHRAPQYEPPREPPAESWTGAQTTSWSEAPPEPQSEPAAPPEAHAEQAPEDAPEAALDPTPEPQQEPPQDEATETAPEALSIPEEIPEETPGEIPAPVEAATVEAATVEVGGPEAEPWPPDRMAPTSEIVVEPPPESPARKAIDLPPNPYFGPAARLRGMAALAPLIAAIQDDDERRKSREPKSLRPANGVVPEPEPVEPTSAEDTLVETRARDAVEPVEPAKSALPIEPALRAEPAVSEAVAEAPVEIESAAPEESDDSISIPEDEPAPAALKAAAPEIVPAEEMPVMAAGSETTDSVELAETDLPDSDLPEADLANADLPPIEIPPAIEPPEAAPKSAVAEAAPAIVIPAPPSFPAPLKAEEKPPEDKPIEWIDSEAMPANSPAKSPAKPGIAADVVADLKPAPVAASAKRRNRAWQWHAAGIAAAVLIIAGPLAALHLADQDYGKLLALAGLEPAADQPGAGLGLANIVTARRAVGGVQVLVLRGEVVNTSTRAREIPPLRGALLGEGNRELQYWTFTARTARLDGGQRVGFETVIRNPSADATDVKVSFLKAGG